MRKFLIALITTALTLAMSTSALAFTSSEYNTDETRALEYIDVSGIDTYLEAIGYLSILEILTGDPEGTFRPNEGLNRAEMVKIIVEAEGISIAGFDTSCFEDVPAGEWFTPHVCAAKDANLIVGFDGNLFKPSQEVTFVEALKITLAGMGIPFDEDPDPALWYRTVIRAASQDNLIPFTIDNITDLQRNEMADLITRILKNRDGLLAAYLGSRSSIVVTYETIIDGRNLALEQANSTTEIDVQISNLSDQVSGFNMPISPAFVQVHGCSVDLIQEGQTLHSSWEPLAEWGDPAALTGLYDGVPVFISNTTTSAGIAPGSSTTVTLTIPTFETNICVTVAAMAVGTNDGLLISTAPVDLTDITEGPVAIFDAGTENNTTINAGFAGGQPDDTKTAQENMDAGTPTDPQATVVTHPDFAGIDPIMSVKVGPKGINFSAIVVEMTSSGFSPATITIAEGDTIRWVNADTADHWPASSTHPTHQDYPAAGDCGGIAFDSCQRIAPGESWELTLHSPGTWAYHDHLNPANTGTITVETAA